MFAENTRVFAENTRVFAENTRVFAKNTRAVHVCFRMASVAAVQAQQCAALPHNTALKYTLTVYTMVVCSQGTVRGQESPVKRV